MDVVKEADVVLLEQKTTKYFEHSFREDLDAKVFAAESVKVEKSFYGVCGRGSVCNT